MHQEEASVCACSLPVHCLERAGRGPQSCGHPGTTRQTPALRINSDLAKRLQSIADSTPAQAMHPLCLPQAGESPVAAFLGAVALGVVAGFRPAEDRAARFCDGARSAVQRPTRPVRTAPGTGVPGPLVRQAGRGSGKTGALARRRRPRSTKATASSTIALVLMSV